MQGVRIYPEDGDNVLRLKSGEYGKFRGVWYACPPLPWNPNHPACLAGHSVTEHEDGTISVSPSILIRIGHTKQEQWHGYLKHGMWTEC